MQIDQIVSAQFTAYLSSIKPRKRLFLLLFSISPMIEAEFERLVWKIIKLLDSLRLFISIIICNPHKSECRRPLHVHLPYMSFAASLVEKVAYVYEGR